MSDRIALDWLEFTLFYNKTDFDLNRALDVATFVACCDDFEERRPAGGYDVAVSVSGGGWIAWNTKHSEFGLHVALPASALAHVAAKFGHVGFDGISDFDFRQYLAFIVAAVPRFDLLKFSRVDLAFDDFSGLLNLSKIEGLARDYISGNDRTQILSNFKRGRLVEDFATGGKTVYFGSPKSDLQIRFYDKRIEQGLQESIEHWVRCEAQCRGNEANYIGWRIAMQSSIDIPTEYLVKVLRFLDKTDLDKNKSRRRLADWWRSFTGDRTRLKFGMAGKYRTLETSQQWLKSAASGALGAVRAEFGQAGIEDIFLAASERSKKRYAKLQAEHKQIVLHRASLADKMTAEYLSATSAYEIESIYSVCEKDLEDLSSLVKHHIVFDN